MCYHENRQRVIHESPQRVIHKSSRQLVIHESRQRVIQESRQHVIHDLQGHQLSIFLIPLRFLYTFLIINSLPEGTNVGTPPFIGFFARRIASKGWRGLKSALAFHRYRT